eukprot:GFUD01053535.1.p1 GENE.GFUD01053535.1~~GFUD01053535.1.p1  ORF type:complete len:125 (+),score=16.79 GFUD01053535.1:90-464(+)
MNTLLVLSIIVLSLAIEQSQGLFFGTPSSLCNSDSQCPSFGRSECLGTSFIFCFGPSRGYTVSGRCLNRSNFFCAAGNFLGGGRRNRNCNYRECAQCLQDSDCRGYNQYCSGNNCNTRTQTNTG